MKNSDSSHCSQLPQKNVAEAPLAVPRHPLAVPSGDPAQAPAGTALPDLRQEGANMLRLALSQEGAGTPLCISSRQAQVVLGQF